jgi:hypothetical protein
MCTAVWLRIVVLEATTPNISRMWTNGARVHVLVANHLAVIAYATLRAWW